MKLIIQIPCYNEAPTIALTINQIPRAYPGITQTEILIIDDGSNDNTAENARQAGADHIISLPRNQGLAKAFMAGIDACLHRGADIIVNTDADNQYNAEDIGKIIRPILDKKADIVIGARPISTIAHFSPAKKILQKIGSRVVQHLSGFDTQDATSGFRALDRMAAMKLNIVSQYTYTLEMLLQAREKNIRVIDVPIRVNPDLRPSRLVKSTGSYVMRSIDTIFKAFVIYKPFTFFFTIGIFLCVIGTALGLRYLWLLFLGEGRGHVQSLILTSIFIGVGFQVILFAFFSNVQAMNRKLLEDIQYNLRLGHYQKPHHG